MKITIRGETVLIDPEDIDLINAYKWRVDTNARGYKYVIKGSGAGGTRVFLHVLVGARVSPVLPGMKVDHD